MNTSQGWSTSPDYDTAPLGLGIPGVGIGLTPLGPTHAPFLPPRLYPPQYTQYLYGGGDTSGCVCQSCGNVLGYQSTMNGSAGGDGGGSSAISGSDPTSSATATTSTSNVGASSSTLIAASASTSATPTSTLPPPMPLSFTHSYPHTHLPPHPLT